MSPKPSEYDKTIPKYQQVCAIVREAMQSGEFPVGTQLPAERELAKKLNVTPVTLRKALALLVDEGLIQSVRGKGTFVLDPSLGSGDDGANASNRSVALVLIETPSERWDDYAGYNNAEARVLDRHLSRNGYTLTLVYTDSRELAAGRLPLALERHDVEGVILTGFVDDFHVRCMQDKGYPVTVIGNRPIHVPVSQVDVNCVSQVYMMTKELLTAANGRVIFVTRPFDCYFTFEALSGYTKAIREYGACSEVVVLTYTGNDANELRTALKKETGDFGLVVNHTIAHELKSLYREMEWTQEQHPVAMVSETLKIGQELAEQMNAHNGDLELQGAVAAELMMEALNGGGPTRVSVEPEMTCTTENGELRIHMAWKPVVLENAYNKSPQREQAHLVERLFSNLDQ